MKLKWAESAMHYPNVPLTFMYKHCYVYSSFLVAQWALKFKFV